jgi:hypothetical protein
MSTTYKYHFYILSYQATIRHLFTMKIILLYISHTAHIYQSIPINRVSPAT